MAELKDNQTRAWACNDWGQPLVNQEIELKPLDEDEVQIKIVCCGICLSDVDAVRGKYKHYGMYRLPCVAGHEGAGIVETVGSRVRHLKAGDRVGVGVYRDACNVCMMCRTGEDNLCEQKGLTFAHGNSGCFGEHVRIKARFAFKLPDAIAMDEAAPLMCAGVTTFAPFRHENIRAGARVAIFGIGGLGHLAIQFANKFGCEVYALSTSSNKEEQARSLGAHHFVCTSAPEAWKNIANTFDYIFLTAGGGDLNWNALILSLRPNGKIIVIGGFVDPAPIIPALLLTGQKSIVGSAAGSSGVASDMLSFCALHGIRPQIEKFPFEQVNEAMEKVVANQVRFRAVLTREDQQ
eukprot:TRINITY_DN374_c0_g1_i1.p2 TRINITY_DN374_c0_g1~~TRINITY_DN374_c0_g1_i1.p2  ORF type:complete len:378 (+),score=138.26 TRINITY_DN374_c0_g1_i1:86-1135(+)